MTVSAPQGRLSLTDGVAFPTSDVTGAITVYYVPVGGSSVPVFDGADFNILSIGEGLSLPLDDVATNPLYHQAGKNFDVFAFDDAGVLRLGSSSAWASNSVRADGIESFNGLLVNKTETLIKWGVGAADYSTVGARNATYLGSFRATSNGQATDSCLRRVVFNAYNQAPRKMHVSDPIGSYQYKVATFRQFNGNAENKVEFLLGLDGVYVTATVNGVMDSSDATRRVGVVGIGLDSIAATAGDDSYSGFVAGEAAAQSIWAHYKGYPGLGFHYLAPLERGAGNGTIDQRWYGNGSGAFLFRPGIAGEFIG